MAKRAKKASARVPSSLEPLIEGLGVGGDINWQNVLVKALSSTPIPKPKPPPGWGWVWERPAVQFAIGVELINHGLSQLQKRRR